MGWGSPANGQSVGPDTAATDYVAPVAGGVAGRFTFGGASRPVFVTNATGVDVYIKVNAKNAAGVWSDPTASNYDILLGNGDPTIDISAGGVLNVSSVGVLVLATGVVGNLEVKGFRLKDS